MKTDTKRVLKNTTASVCSHCGAETEVSKDGRYVECTHCGRLEPAAPAVENLSNICPCCTHPIDSSHNDFGCDMDGCPCTVIHSPTETKDARPNALPNSEHRHSVDAGLAERIWAVATPTDRADWASSIGLGADTVGIEWESLAPETHTKLLALFEKIGTPLQVKNDAEKVEGGDDIGKPSGNVKNSSEVIHASEIGSRRGTAQAANWARGAKYGDVHIDQDGTKFTALGSGQFRAEFRNRDVAAQGGEESGKPGGTVTVVNAADSVMTADERAADGRRKYGSPA